MTARIAIVGAGPTGFFLAERLLNQTEVPVAVDLFERLPAPYGLVRYGVAPDHEKIRNVTRAFDRTAARPGFRYAGHVNIGTDLSLDDLRTCYDQVCFTTGAQTDRRMGIPGEDLRNSHPATEFVAWYNGHPEFRDRTFHLGARRVAVIGVGNVAVDVARILCRTPEELASTDIADHALEALATSGVEEVMLLGRRGPVQAAFTTPEVKELGELAGADVRVRAEEVTLDPESEIDLAAGDEATRRKVEILQAYAHRTPTGAARTLTLRFLVSPVALLGDDTGAVRAIHLVRTALVRNPDGSLSAHPTGVVEEIPVDLVFRSVGYRGVPIPGIPFDEKRGVVPNAAGRVLDPTTGAPLPRTYVAGWIKRGPSGVIGTNKPCAAETAAAMLDDLRSGSLPPVTGPDAMDLLRERGVRYLTFPEWESIRSAEEARGKAAGRPRVKLVDPAEYLPSPI